MESVVELRTKTAPVSEFQRNITPAVSEAIDFIEHIGSADPRNQKQHANEVRRKSGLQEAEWFSLTDFDGGKFEPRELKGNLTKLLNLESVHISSTDSWGNGRYARFQCGSKAKPCNFVVYLYWHKEEKMWLLKKNGAGCRFHSCERGRLQAWPSVVSDRESGNEVDESLQEGRESTTNDVDTMSVESGDEVDELLQQRWESTTNSDETMSLAYFPAVLDASWMESVVGKCDKCNREHNFWKIRESPKPNVATCWTCLGFKELQKSLGAPNLPPDEVFAILYKLQQGHPTDYARLSATLLPVLTENMKRLTLEAMADLTL